MESTPTPTQDSAASVSTDPKYQKKSEKTPNSSGGKPERRTRDRGGRGGGGGRRGSRGGFGDSADNFLVNAQNGIASTHAVGINYSDQFGKKVELAGSYFFNKTDIDETEDQGALEGPVNSRSFICLQIDLKLNGLVVLQAQCQRAPSSRP